MESDTLINKTEDSVKRGKLIVLSLLIGLSIFVETLIEQQDQSVTRVLSISFIYLFVSFVGLIWAFDFQVKIKSLYFLFQSSLFVMSEYLFIQLFFVEKFSRIYEGILLFILVALVSIATYVSFLMANVFNVNLYKSIPLANVGRTTSYIISTLSVFFITFALLSLQPPIYILLPIELFISVFFSYIHLRVLGYESFVLSRKVMLVSLIVFIMFIASFLTGVIHEVSALSPTVGYFVGIGMANIESNKNRNQFEMILYILALIGAIFLNFILNILA
jgi:hypothetical protein